ncbi:hypothetical protein L1987_63007 [Smallanthus sonchifolius]|uniref:Uncharacterized protein n=1 Tax=Smallanthus sonchifolius TaxID=185202 RepID=A0ACB9CCE6_9ASTR|nr:hypothetical protein L1987_63007 [Smallanthus sonchifolius]
MPMERHKKMKAELPLSLIECDILPRLPAKSVGRCICVCKQWKSFLLTPMFARKHLHYVTINDYKFLLLDSLPPLSFHTLPLYLWEWCLLRPISIGLRKGPIPIPIPIPIPNPAPRAEYMLASLDGLTETFRKIRYPPLPLDAGDREYCGSLVVLKGRIHFGVSNTIIYEDNIDIDLKHGDLWRMDGDGDGDGWEKVATFSDPLYDEFRRQHLCRECIGYWLAIFEENNCFKKMNLEDMARQCGYFCSRSWEYRSSRMMYVETLVFTNPQLVNC